MELIFLGTSSAVPSKHRNHASIALKAFGEVMMFDCGEGTQRQLANAKISPMKIDKVFLSHLHGDHILGLPGLIQSMGFRGRVEPLHIYGPKGISRLNEIISQFGYFTINFPIEIHELVEGKILESDDYIIECVKTKHNVYNLSYSVYEKKKPRFLKEKAIELGVKPGPDFGKLHDGFELKVGEKIISPEQVLGKKRHGHKIVYSGDTKPCKAMIEFAKEATVLIHESTYKTEDEIKATNNFHSTSKQAAKIAKEANVKKLILTHISTRYTNIDDLKKEAIEVFENSKVAYDFMNLKL
ncbi:MAG: ribonuclease Z [Methanobacteriaceae archaeon]|jgi:ribonuclease Z|nr:ribonuclease Z [Candidatus Methanorudis spinitermitis]